VQRNNLIKVTDTMEKDIVIASLEFGKQKLLNGERVALSDFNNYLVAEGFLKTNEGERNAILVEGLYNQIFTRSINVHANELHLKLMSLESYLGLLDYEDLRQARLDSQQARKEAKWALILNIISLTIATGVGLAQIFLD
jgi:hypothetical protein